MSARTSRVRTRRARTAQLAVLALVAGLLVILAFRDEGAPVHDVDLNDGGVWVANERLSYVGRLNNQIGEIDMVVPTSPTSDAIYQQGAAVSVFDDRAGGEGGTYSLVDVVTGAAEPIDLPGDGVAVSARGTVGVLDRKTGDFWVRRTQKDDLSGFADGLPPTGKVSKNSQIAAALDGTILLADRSAGEVRSWRLDETDSPVEGKTFDFKREFLDDAQLSAVGSTPVVVQNNDVLRPGKDPVTLEGDDPALQQPGEAGDRVRVATTTGLWSVAMGGGDVDELSDIDASGPPAAPLVHNECVYGAWADPTGDNVVVRCDDGSGTAEHSDLSQENNLIFRRNRDVVVLNNAANGVSDVVQLSGLARVDDWDSFDPNKPDPQESKDDDEVRTTERNQPPEAVDDKFGGRAGGTVILPVTLNDRDPDGDLLVITELPKNTNGVDDLTIVGQGTQVQAKINSNASGTVGFEYSITDGYAGHGPSSATVSVKIFPGDVDKQPVLDPARVPTLEVVKGEEATVNVLPAWLDPEGDSVVLVGASARDNGGDVAFRPDGAITYADDGRAVGQESIDYVVRGGGEKAVEKGTIAIQVVEEAKARPTSVPDLFTGTVGSTIVMDPLANDSDPFGEDLTLGRIGDLRGGAAQIGMDSTTGLATFVAQAPGSYFASYTSTARNGVTSPPTPIRIDVVPRAANNRDPVAMRDIAVMRSGAATLVDVLANDTDPDGDVLVVQGVTVPARWRGHVTASLVNKQFVRVEVDDTVQGERPELEYLLSDGVSNQVAGSIVLAEGEDVDNHRPVAIDDSYTVRAGTVVTLPVRDNDRDPDGDQITVSQADLFDLGDKKLISERLAPIVATGTGIRLLVPDDGTTAMQFGYGVRDTSGVRSDARVVLNVLPDTPRGNQDPQPHPIEDRTVTGQVIRVPVDSYGSDPDGDPVVFAGIDSPPSLGRIVSSGASWFEYEPYVGDDNTGTDVFQIRVKDQYGAEATTEVRIGVAARTQYNQTPAALDDTITVKPGRTIQYRAMDNDSDPDGDSLILLPDKLYGVGDSDATVLDNGLIQVTSPEITDGRQSTLVLTYTITDGLGVEATAQFTVISREDAPDHPPIATDDIADASDVNGKVAGDTVDVDVLANDGDLDGSSDELKLEPLNGRREEVVDGKFRITLSPKGQVVPYAITDRTDQTSYGFVYVTGTEDLPPTLDPAKVPLEVVGGEDLTIDLEEVVIVRSGRAPKIVKKNDLYSSVGDVEATGDSQMVFHTAKDYAGPAVVTLDVHDGVQLNAADTLISQITIPITVLPSGNVPPTIRSANIEVYAGEPPVTLMLDRMAEDANEGDSLKFSVEGATKGLRAEIKDGLLSVRADDDAVSATVPLSLTVTDGKTDPVAGTVEVILHGIDDGAGGKPLMTLRELTLPDGVVGKAARFDIADAVQSDPFPDKAKTVTSLSVDGPAKATGEGSRSVVVTPTADGTITVTYTADDGSGDIDRAATGKIVLAVAGLPDAPGKPKAVEGGPTSVQLSWNAPRDTHGADVINYVVRWNGGQDSQDCKQQQCVVEGLDSGETYQFTVAAQNGVTVDGKDEGPESPASDKVTPDEVPGQMAPPEIISSYEDRNGKLELKFEKPDNPGSEITTYQFQISKGSNGGIDKSVRYPATTTPWNDLTNGEEYEFRVRAVNKEGPTDLRSGWSLWSETEKPFTTPAQLPRPTLDADNGVAGSGGYLTARWQGSTVDTNGGDEVTAYKVRLYKDGVALPEVSVDKTATVRVFDGAENGHEYAVQVMAQNRAGWSDWSEKSEVTLSWDPATAPTAMSNGGDCPNSTCSQSTTSYSGKVNFRTPADDGGFDVIRYDYVTEDGRSGSFAPPTTAEGASTSAIVPFKSSGASQWVRLTAITSVQGQDTRGTHGQSPDAFNPYALPGVPSQGNRSSEYRAVGFSWNSGSANGRAIDATQYQIQGSGGAVDAGQSGGSRTVDTAQGGDSACLRVRSHNAAGWSDWGSYLCGQAQPRKVSVTFTQTTNVSTSACSRPCYHVGWAVEGFRSGATYSADWKVSGSQYAVCNSDYELPRTVNVGSDGRASRTENWYVSYTCSNPSGQVSVRVDGVVGTQAVPSG